MRIKTIRHILGYVVGLSIFAYLIPAGLIKFSNNNILLVFEPPLWLRIFVFAIMLLLFIVGLVFVIWSNLALNLIGKGGPADGFNVAISPRSDKLVVEGPYRYTRNPMVFGALCCYYAIALYMHSLSCILLLLLCMGLVVVYLKFTEEKRLSKDFGKEYEEYKKRVPLLIPRKIYHQKSC